MTKTGRRISLKSAMLAGAGLAMLASAAQAQSNTIEFDIDAQELGAALTEFGIQSGQEIYFVEADIRGETTSGVEGSYAPATALNLILADSDIPFTTDENGTVLVGNEYVPVASLGEEMTPAPFRVALLDQEETVREVEQEQNDDEAAERREDVIVVTGTNIRGVRNDTAPIVTYNIDEIELSGATTLDRFLETLPQNLNSQTGPAAEFLDSASRTRATPDGGSGVDLRGLGVGTTLVLLNGQRLTNPSGESPDTSLIPLGAIERVEVLTDGASSIYGSDAIAGVVNIVLKRDIEGVELTTSYGSVTDGSHDRFQANVSGGTSWGSGSGLVSYSYSDQSALFAEDRDFTSILTPTSLIPNDQRNSVLGVIEQDLTSKLSITGSALYSNRSSDRFIAFLQRGNPLVRDTQSEQEQLFLASNISYEIAENLTFDLSANYLTYDSDAATINREGTSSPGFDREEEGTNYEITGKISGSLIQLPGGDLSFSVGGGYNSQVYDVSQNGLDDPTNFDRFDRESMFAFAEVYVPIIGPDQSIPGVERLEFSGAVRHTEYDDFGSRAVPRIGLLWAPSEDLSLRATYSQSFRAPTLREITDTGPAVLINRFADFGAQDPFSPDGSSVILLSTGSTKGELTPELSDSYTFGFDYEPAYIDGLRLSATYFKIDYVDRLGAPAANVLAPLFDPEGFSFLLNTSPTLEGISDAVSDARFISDREGLISDVNDPSTYLGVVTVLLDNRRDNLAEFQTDGVDVNVNYSLDYSFGTLNLGASASATLNSFQRATADSIKEELIDTVGNPVSLRGSLFVGVSTDKFNSRVTMNYVDDYSDPFQIPEQAVDNWTTFDFSARYQLSEDPESFLNETVLSLTINNIFDEDPPSVGSNDVSGGGLVRPVGYDPVNANPIGRFVTVSISKRF